MWHSPWHSLVAVQLMHMVAFPSVSVPNGVIHLSSPSFSFCLGGRTKLSLPTRVEWTLFGETVGVGSWSQKLIISPFSLHQRCFVPKQYMPISSDKSKNLFFNNLFFSNFYKIFTPSRSFSSPALYWLNMLFIPPFILFLCCLIKVRLAL